MTVEEAKRLKIGDYILFNGQKCKVLHTTELRSGHTGEIYIDIKCRRQNDIIRFMNKYAEKCEE